MDWESSGVVEWSCDVDVRWNCVGDMVIRLVWWSDGLGGQWSGGVAMWSEWSGGGGVVVTDNYWPEILQVFHSSKFLVTLSIIVRFLCVVYGGASP